MNILCFTGSPRKQSLSSVLMAEFLDNFKRIGCEINVINAYEADVEPCTACGRCAVDAVCIHSDRMIDIYNLIRSADIIAVSSPLYFSSFPSPLKAIIDRCQLIWEENRRLGIKSKEKKGFFFCSAGSDYKDIFAAVLICIKHFYNTINTVFDENEFILMKNCDTISKISPVFIEKCRMLSNKYSDQ